MSTIFSRKTIQEHADLLAQSRESAAIAENVVGVAAFPRHRPLGPNAPNRLGLRKLVPANQSSCLQLPQGIDYDDHIHELFQMSLKKQRDVQDDQRAVSC